MKNLFSAVKLLVLLASITAAQTNYYVDTSQPDDNGDGLSWATAKRTLQAGVDISTGGDIVNVAAGAYTLSGRLTINKGISLIGVDESTTIIDASANGTDYGILISASNTTFKNFTIMPPLGPGTLGTSTGGGYSIHVSNTPSTLNGTLLYPLTNPKAC